MTTERRHRRRPSEVIARLSQWRHAFRQWRRSRPFWAGVLTVVGAGEIVMAPGLELGGITIHQGVAGIASWLMAALMAFMALVMWFQPHLRLIAGVATILFSLASFLTSNFGGFLIGMLLGIIGGAMAVAWDVDKPTPSADESMRRATAEPVQTVALDRPNATPVSLNDQAADGNQVVTTERAPENSDREAASPSESGSTEEEITRPVTPSDRSLADDLVGRETEGRGG